MVRLLASGFGRTIIILSFEDDTNLARGRRRDRHEDYAALLDLYQDKDADAG